MHGLRAAGKRIYLGRVELIDAPDENPQDIFHLVFRDGLVCIGDQENVKRARARDTLLAENADTQSIVLRAFTRGGAVVTPEQFAETFHRTLLEHSDEKTEGSGFRDSY